ncbi:MAG: peptide deformylase [Methyloprofundus sp.]|nr:peptide deformylase [Methyloprofundus sp.]
MAVLTVLEFPDSKLRNVAKKVSAVDAKVKSIVDDMFETMYEAHGVGLAAIQVDIQLQIIVIDVSEEKDQKLCFINPEITSEFGTEESDEGCLSVPGIFEPVRRAEKIIVTALNREGDTFITEAEGLLAVCIQHEMDHLKGKLFVDYLSPLKRQRIKKKMLKLHKRDA